MVRDREEMVRVAKYFLQKAINSNGIERTLNVKNMKACLDAGGISYRAIGTSKKFIEDLKKSGARGQ